MLITYLGYLSTFFRFLHKDKIYLINNNNVHISSLNYKKMKIMGYNDREISYISQSEYNEIKKIDTDFSLRFSLSAKPPYISLEPSLNINIEDKIKNINVSRRISVWKRL